MSKPTAEQIAAALGISVGQINLLAKRGMPRDKVKKAKEWFAANGFTQVGHSKSGGATRHVKIHTHINSILGGGSDVLLRSTPKENK